MDLRHRVYLEGNSSGPYCPGILPKFCQNSHAIPKTVSQTVSHRADRSPNSLLHSQFGLEAEVGIEPTHTAFAEPCLTTWLLRRKDRRSIIHSLRDASASFPVRFRKRTTCSDTSSVVIPRTAVRLITTP